LAQCFGFGKFLGRKAITRHLPVAFQQQRRALLEKAKRLYKAKKKIRWTRVDSEYCLFADDEQVFADCSRWLCRCCPIHTFKVFVCSSTVSNIHSYIVNNQWFNMTFKKCPRVKM